MKRTVRGFLIAVLVLSMFGSGIAFAGYKVKGAKTTPTPNGMLVKGV